MCGCALSVRAQWPSAPDAGVSYRHPVPGTITAVALANTCAAHDGLRTAALPADPYFGARGYLALPEDRSTLTEAERLYVHLFRFSAQVARLDTCGCRIYEVHDRGGAEPRARRAHAKHTVKCAVHDDDDDDHTDARADNSRKQRILERASNALGLPAESIRWQFSGARRTRTLTVTLVGGTVQQQTQAQNWADANLGAGRVIVERA